MRVTDRGYFAVGIYHPKNEINIGTLWRSAHNFGARYIFTIGKRYRHQAADTTHAPLHVPMFHHYSFEEFQQNRPLNCALIAVEQSPKSRSIVNFCHPE